MSQDTIFQNLLSLLQKELSVLPDKSEETPNNTLRALWHTAAGQLVSPIAAENLPLPRLSQTQLLQLDELIKSRLAGVPLAHLTERQQFMGMEYIVNKGLYIPRKETELLAHAAIETVKNDYLSGAEITVIDLCTGIGTVALAVAFHCNNTRVLGSDIYTPAIEAAIVNAQHFGLTERATFFNADLFSPFASLQGSVDIIVSAPPYITSAKVKNMAEEIAQHEPEEAFDAGPFGLSIFNQLIALAPTYLRANGYLIFECGLGQGDFLAKRISANKSYSSVTKICDENGNLRVLKAKTAASD
ncbi:MAG: peptide chain release factor N(5)-glutamine methyltransferase [Pseudomonadota bacterium]